MIPMAASQPEVHLKAPPVADATDISLKEYTDAATAALDARVDAADQALREHVAAQYIQVNAALDASRREFEFSRQALQEAINKAETVSALRMEEGDIRLREHISAQSESLDMALEASRRETAFARDSLDKSIGKLEQQMRVRIEEGDARLREHIVQQYTQIGAALESARRETSFASEASQKAIDKAEAATEKRFEAVNEFRGQLADQAARFIPREVADAQWEQSRADRQAITERLQSIEGSYVQRDSMTSRLAEIDKRVDENRSRMLPRETFDSTMQGINDWRIAVDARINQWAGRDTQVARTQDSTRPYAIWALGAVVSLLIALTIVAIGAFT